MVQAFIERYARKLEKQKKRRSETKFLRSFPKPRWRIEGKDGAAAIPGLHPSTLRTRMHKLGILRPETKESN